MTERGVQGDIGDHVAEFVQQATQWALHVVLPRKHAVDCVQRHAHE